MNIDRRLHFVIPVERENGPVYVHSTPIGRPVFEKYFLVISNTFAAIYNHGLGAIAGPRIAALMLREVAQTANRWEGEDGVERGLMAEIRRLTNVAVPGTHGWETMPWQQVVDGKTLDEQDISEVENSLVFFIVASLMHKKTEARPILEAAANLWGAQISSLDFTAFLSSLPTLIPPASSGARATPSSIPF